MTEKLKATVAALRQQMEDTVHQAASVFPSFGYQEGYADGTWRIEVQPDGQVLNGGYAEEFRGPVSIIKDLTSAELGGLIDEIERRFAGQSDKRSR